MVAIQMKAKSCVQSAMMEARASRNGTLSPAFNVQE